MRGHRSYSVLGLAFLAQGADVAISVAALKLSGVQVSTTPTSSFPLFPPTGTGMLMAPLWWVQLSLGDMRRECQAGAPRALEDGLPPVPPLALQDLANRTAEDAVHPSYFLGSLGPGKGQSESWSLQRPAVRRALPRETAACTGAAASPDLGPRLLRGRLSSTTSLRAQFALCCTWTWTCTYHSVSEKPFPHSWGLLPPGRAGEPPR